MKEVELWKFVTNKLSEKKDVMLLTVADSYKSSPGRAGFKLAVSDNEEMVGTVGGGIMEYDMLNESKKYFNLNNPATLIKKLYHNVKAPGTKSGLICGGTQSIIFHKIEPDKDDKIKNHLNACIERKKSLMKLSPEGLEFITNKWNAEKFTFNYKTKTNWQYEENCGTPSTAYVIGGGHVGLAVSRAMSTLDFYVITFDRREVVFTMKNNVYSDQKIITEYENVGNYIEEGDSSFVIVVTAEYSTDKAALKSIINKNFKYLGLMGSGSKIYKIFSELKQEGIDQSLLNKINTPIGIEIKGESPEEIAISIAAEIIKVKNESIPD